MPPPPDPDLRPVADRAMEVVRERLVGRSDGGYAVASTLHYGAVDLDPAHLVVWLLLEAPAGHEVPEWLEVTPLLVPAMRPAEPDYDWLLSLAAGVADAFSESGWPDGVRPRVMVDGEARVAAAGGWNYFR